MSKNKKKIYYKGKKYEAPINAKYDDNDLALISSLFLDNLDLLMSLKKHFFQGNLTAKEIITLDEFVKNYESVELIKKVFLPQINGDEFFGMSNDIWNSIHITDYDLESNYLKMEIIQLEVDYLEQQLRELVNRNISQKIKLENLIFKRNKKPREAFIELMARKELIRQIDFNLHDLIALSVQFKPKTIEIDNKRKEKVRQDSLK